jgi:hypothetical protein
MIYNVSAGQMETYNGGVWGAMGGGGGGGAPSISISPAPTDAVGVIGVSTLYARGDHKHPEAAVSADANNILSTGTDGLHNLTLNASAFVGNLAITDTTLQSVVDKLDALTIGKPRVFADNTTVAPATAGIPTVTEISAAFPAAKDTVIYYTGDDLPTSTPLYVFHSDSAGVITLVEKPAAALAATTVFNNAIGWSLNAGEYIKPVAVPPTAILLQVWELISPTNIRLVSVGLNRTSSTTVEIHVPSVPDGRFAGYIAYI